LPSLDLGFSGQQRPAIPRAIARYGGHLNVVRLTNDRDVAAFSRAQGLV